MIKRIAILVALTGLLLPAAASADTFALEADVQGSYLRLNQIKINDAGDLGVYDGYCIGAKGRIQILFFNLVIDWMHGLNNEADFGHIGLGLGYRFDSLPLVDLYVIGTAGLLLWDFDGAGGASPEMGFQARGGGGIEIPFAGDWLAFGVGVYFGGHLLSGEFNYDMSADIHFGLRI